MALDRGLIAVSCARMERAAGGDLRRGSDLPPTAQRMTVCYGFGYHLLICHEYHLSIMRRHFWREASA